MATPPLNQISSQFSYNSRDGANAIEANTHAVKITYCQSYQRGRALWNNGPEVLLERLYRYATRQFLYTHPASHWEGVDQLVNYMVGVPTDIPGLDPYKAYLPFDQSEIWRVTGKKVTTIPLDLEIKQPTERKTKNYMDVSKEWGFYEPHLLSEATIALAGIQAAGFKITADGELVNVKADRAMYSIPFEHLPQLLDSSDLQQQAEAIAKTMITSGIRSNLLKMRDDLPIIGHEDFLVFSLNGRLTLQTSLLLHNITSYDRSNGQSEQKGWHYVDRLTKALSQKERFLALRIRSSDFQRTI